MNNIDLENLPKGTEVKIISNKGVGFNSDGLMDKFLGTFQTISKTWNKGGGFILLEGEAGHWAWSIYDFERIKLPDSNIWLDIKDGKFYPSKLLEPSNTEVKDVVLEEAKYYVFVDGAKSKSPKHIHNTLESAEIEAQRLASKEVGVLVSVCKIEKQFKSKIIVEEV